MRARAERAFARLAAAPVVGEACTRGRLDAGGARGACAGLPALLGDVVRFVRGHCAGLLAAAAEVAPPVPDDDEGSGDGGGNTTKDGKGEAGPDGSEEGSGGGPAASPPVPPASFDFVCRGVLPAVASTLAERFGGAVFAPGIAATFHANYSALSAFLGRLQDAEDAAAAEAAAAGGGAAGEGAGGLFAALEREGGAVARRRSVRRHPVARALMARFNLSVYYHLRFQEFAAAVELALCHPVLRDARDGAEINAEDAGDAGAGADADADAALERHGAARLHLAASRAAWRALCRCWAGDVCLPPLAGRLLRCAAQTLRRLACWAFAGAASCVPESSAAHAAAADAVADAAARLGVDDFDPGSDVAAKAAWKKPLAAAGSAAAGRAAGGGGAAAAAAAWGDGAPSPAARAALLAGKDLATLAALVSTGPYADAAARQVAAATGDAAGTGAGAGAGSVARWRAVL